MSWTWQILPSSCCHQEGSFRLAHEAWLWKEAQIASHQSEKTTLHRDQTKQGKQISSTTKQLAKKREPVCDIFSSFPQKQWTANATPIIFLSICWTNYPSLSPSIFQHCGTAFSIGKPLFTLTGAKLSWTQKWVGDHLWMGLAFTRATPLSYVGKVSVDIYPFSVFLRALQSPPPTTRTRQSRVIQ